MDSATRDHNKAVLEGLKVGDMVEFPRWKGVYAHIVYLGNEEIVHLAGRGDGEIKSSDGFTICGMAYDKAVAKIENFWKVVNGSKAKKNNDKDKKYSPSSVEEIVKRAKSMVGEVKYNLLWNNCEHFASYIRYGKKCSEQAHKVVNIVLKESTGVFKGTTLGKDVDL